MVLDAGVVQSTERPPHTPTRTVIESRRLKERPDEVRRSGPSATEH